MKRFEEIESDYDRSIQERVIEGHLTGHRYEILRNYVSKFNEDNSYLYGISPNGYAYGCGCSHDCCGCLVSVRMSMTIIQSYGGAFVKLTISQSYNY
jgi:hypothetical protein